METTATGVSWRPLLAGSLADRALETVEEIAETLGALPTDTPTSWSLVDGDAGLALFFAYLGHRDTSRQHLDRAIAALAEQPMTPDLCNGFSGVAWVVEHLTADDVDEEADVNQAIDEALEAGLSDACPEAGWWQRYELLSGLAGLGVYALERFPRPGAARVVELTLRHLAAVSERAPDGITWRTEPEQLPLRARKETPGGCYNLGVAHGVPGVIGYLGQVCAAGFAETRARELLEGGMSWFLAQRLPPGSPAEFSAWLSADGCPPADRVSWCYGNPGIAVALLGAARALGREDWEREALDLALVCAERDLRDSRVVEASICHGSAGNGHLYNRLFQATGDERFRSAALTWFEQTFEFRKPGRGLAGFETLVLDSDERRAWVGNAGFLVGIAGIGLALLAATREVEPAWDRVLLAAIPPRH